MEAHADGVSGLEDGVAAWTLASPMRKRQPCTPSAKARSVQDTATPDAAVTAVTDTPLRRSARVAMLLARSGTSLPSRAREDEAPR